MSVSHDYSLFGLNLRSEWPLPELPTLEDGTIPDVRIVRAAPPAGLPQSPGLHPSQDGILLSIEDVARYWVTGGTSISVEPDAGAREENVRLFLLGSAMGLLLHQRGLLPLHANAVEVSGRAIAFIGRSGAGKSTLAGWFHDHGHRVIGDDVCVVRFDEQGYPVATAGIPRLRLWKDALLASGRRTADYQRSYAGDEDYEKYDVPLAVEEGPNGAPLAAIYLLDEGAEFAIARLDGLDAAEALFANTYRGAFVEMAGQPREHWEACLRLLACIPVFRVSRLWGLARIDDETKAIIAHAKSLEQMPPPVMPGS